MRKLLSLFNYLKTDYRCIFLEVDILVGTEVFCERYAGKVAAPGAVVDRCDVEDEGEHQEDEEGDAESEDHQHCSSGLRICGSAEGDVWHESIGQKKSSDETKEVGKVVDPWHCTQ